MTYSVGQNNKNNLNLTVLKARYMLRTIMVTYIE